MTAVIIPFPGTEAKQAEGAAFADFRARSEERLAHSPWLRETLARAQASIAKLPPRAAKRDDSGPDLLMFKPEDRERAAQLLEAIGQAMCKLPRKQ